MNLDETDAADPDVDETDAIVETDMSQLRRLHPLTPLFNSWRLVGLAGLFGFGAFRDDLSRLEWIWHALHGDAEIGVMVRAFLVVAVLAGMSVLLGWLSWRVTGFAIVGGHGEPATLLYHRGLINRQRSQVRLKRVQSVDVNQPFLPRLAGLAALRLEMAAGEGASVNLSYLGLADAWVLREEILRHTSGDTPLDEPGAERLPPRPDPVIGHVETARLIQASVLDSAGVLVALIVWVLGVVVVGLTFGWQALAAWLTLILPLTIGFLVQLRKQAQTILRDANFTVMRTPTGIRTRAGLSSTRNRTIDLDRVQTVRVERPLLWRRLGWARVDVDVAGAADSGGSGASLMPVAEDPIALALASDVASEPIEPPGGVRADWGGRLVPAGQRARWLDPFTASWLGVALLDHGALTRTGGWTRTIGYVPFARIQSVSAQQGWWQRRLGLATVYVDLPSGTTRWAAPHRDVADAAELVRALSAAARSHRRSPSRMSAPCGQAEKWGT